MLEICKNINNIAYSIALDDPRTETKINDFLLSYIPDEPFENSDIEIWFPSGDTKIYDNLEDFKQDVDSGKIRRNFQAKYYNNKNWVTINTISKHSTKIRNLFRPIYKSRNNGIFYGIIVGTIIKFIDTSYLLLQIEIDITSMFFFLISVFLGCCTAGLSLGAPFGSAIGIILGYYKAKRIGKIVDIEIENFNFYFLGLILPIVFLLLIIPMWIFWLSPKLFELI